MISILLLLTSLIFFAFVLLNIAGWSKVGESGENPAGQVSVLIPARNEESNLAACLNAVLGQGRTVAEVLVYDDHSTDGTRRIINEYSERDSRVRAIETLPLAPGWCGKNFACAQLAKAAMGNWLLFIDADARLAGGAVPRMLAEMERRRLKFLSCWPGLKMISFWERALMPMLNFVVLSIFPAAFSIHDDRPSLAIAHGACLLFERESYHAIGGHAVVRDQIFEDVRLAQLWRERGMRGLCLDGQNLVEVRMYTSFGEIRRGFQKNFFPAFRHEINFWIFILFHTTVFLAPFFLLIIMPNGRLAVSAAIILLTRVCLAVYFHHPLWSAFLHPLSEMILISIGLSSWRRCKSGKGVEWRGRQYYPVN
jgi:glycosyltransferase involved in cell wall biosynthesis